MTSIRKEFPPHTWTDGHGRWHASVALSDNPRRDARRAREAIIGELRQRVADLDPSGVRVERYEVTGHGTAKYREKD